MAARIIIIETSFCQNDDVLGSSLTTSKHEMNMFKCKREMAKNCDDFKQHNSKKQLHIIIIRKDKAPTTFCRLSIHVLTHYTTHIECIPNLINNDDFDYLLYLLDRMIWNLTTDHRQFHWNYLRFHTISNAYGICIQC